MRRLLIALLFVFASLPVAGVNTVVVMRHAAAAATFCDGTFQFCDEFGGTLGNFTQTLGSWSISSGFLVGPTSGQGILTHNTATSSATQYAIIRLDTLSGQQGVKLRGGSTGGNFYGVYRIGNTAEWSSFQANGSWNETISSCAITWAADDYMMVKVSGTVGSTTIDVWQTATMPTVPPSTGPSCTMAVGPSALADDGTVIGVYSDSGGSDQNYDDFAAGSP